MRIITAPTAARIRELVTNRPRTGAGNAGSGRVAGRLPVLVRCTSATAAAGSGVGAQCYPGVIVDPLADQTTQPEKGTVWLTLMDDGGAAAVPTNNRVYECLLAGSITATGTDTRPRAFGVADHSAPADPDASVTVRGYVNTTAQSFAGAKTFTGDVVVSGHLYGSGTAVAINPADARTVIYSGGIHTSNVSLVNTAGPGHNIDILFVDSSGLSQAGLLWNEVAGGNFLQILADKIVFGKYSGGAPAFDFGGGSATGLTMDGGTW